MKILQVLLVLAGTALFFVSEAQNAPERREWTMKPTDKAEHVQFGVEFRRPGNRWHHSSPVPWSSFRGLTKDQADKLNTPTKFEYVRDAGKLLCEGTFHWGRGSGTFTFEANPAYKAELGKLGFHISGNKQELEYFMADVSLDFARAVKDANIGASSEELYEMRIHGLSPSYIAEMRASGHTGLNARDYIEMKIHGVSTEFVRDLKRGGYDLSAQKIVQLRIHGVDTPFMSDLKRAGYDLSADQIIEMRNHGVNRDYIQSLAAYGLKPDAEDLIKLRNHGVQPEYLKGLKEAGYSSVDADQVVELRIHGVSTDFVRQARDLGYNFRTEELTKLRNHGVDGSYLRKIKESGYNNLSADKIVQLRIHGVD